MGLFSVMCFAFLSLSLANSVELEEVMFYESDNNLWASLNFIHNFEREYGRKRVQIEAMYDASVSSYDVDQCKGFGEAISGFVYRANELRNLLCKGQPLMIEISEDLTHQTKYVDLFLVVFKDILLELEQKIHEWETTKDDPQSISKVTDAVPLEWFMNHGFDVETLNDATLEQVKTALDEIIGDGKLLDTLSECMGARYTTLVTSEIGGRLAWLATVAASQNVLGIFESYLESCKIQVPDETAADIIRYLRELGAEESPLNQLLGKNQRDNMHPIVMSLMQPAVFMQDHAKRYFQGLAISCSTLLNDLDRFNKEVTAVRGTWLNLVMWNQGFYYRAQEEQQQNLATKISSLLNPGGSLAKLCAVIKQYDAFFCTTPNLKGYCYHSAFPPTGLAGLLIISLIGF